MKRLLFAIIPIFTLLSCNNNVNSQKENDKDQITELSFNNIKIGADTALIDSASFCDYTSHGKGYYSDATDNLITNLENVYRKFNTTIVGDDNRELKLLVTVFEKSGKISKIICETQLSNLNSILNLLENKYGNHGEPQFVECPGSGVFSCKSYPWLFNNNLALYVQEFKYSGQEYGLFEDLAKIGHKKDCAIIAYCDLNVINEYKTNQDNIKKAAQREEEKKKQIRLNELSKRKNNQDI